MVTAAQEMTTASPQRGPATGEDKDDAALITQSYAGLDPTQPTQEAGPTQTPTKVRVASSPTPSTAAATAGSSADGPSSGGGGRRRMRRKAPVADPYSPNGPIELEEEETDPIEEDDDEEDADDL